MRRRQPRRLPEAVTELLGYELVYAEAAGDPLAAEHLAASRSWRDMLAISDGDPEIADLFLTFARADFASWAGR